MDSSHQRPDFICHPDGRVEDVRSSSSPYGAPPLRASEKPIPWWQWAVFGVVVLGVGSIAVFSPRSGERPPERLPGLFSRTRTKSADELMRDVMNTPEQRKRTAEALEALRKIYQGEVRCFGCGESPLALSDQKPGLEPKYPTVCPKCGGRTWWVLKANQWSVVAHPSP